MEDNTLNANADALHCRYETWRGKQGSKVDDGTAQQQGSGGQQEAVQRFNDLQTAPFKVITGYRDLSARQGCLASAVRVKGRR